MANFLVVCGGTGRGILNSIHDIGFDAALQIDVLNQSVTFNDGTLLNLQLPQPGDTSMTSVAAITWLDKLLNENLRDALIEKEKITVQLNILNEKLTGNKLSSTPGASIITNELESEIEVAEKALRRETGRINTLTKRIAHASTAKKITATSTLVDGMSQAPLIGRSYIEMTKPTNSIRSSITNLFSKRPDNDRSATFWVIASMCGGTGQGIYLHVIDQIASLQASFGDITFKIRVVRIGSLTYRSINPKIQLNAFWSLATDFGYIYQHDVDVREQYKDFELNYYYIDLNDVGSGTAAIPVREEIVKTAFRAITQRELDVAFVGVFNNLNLAPKVVMTRMGEWGAEFRESDLYSETIAEVSNQIDELLKVENRSLLSDTRDIVPSTAPGLIKANVANFPATEEQFGKLSFDSLRTMLKNDFPISSLTTESISSYLQREEWRQYTRFVRAIFGDSESCFSQLIRSVTLTVGWRNETDTPTNLSGELDEIKYSHEYLQKIRTAKQIILRAEDLLLRSEPQKSLHVALNSAWKKMQNKGNAWQELTKDDANRKKDVRDNLEPFIELYAKILRLTTEYNNAQRVLVSARTHLEQFTKVVAQEHSNTQDTQQSVPVTQSATLGTLIENKTWLRHMIESLAGSEEVALTSGKFKKSVLLGAQGLTEEGLKRVVGVPNDYNIEQIVAKINSNVGNNPSSWFQDMVPDFNSLPVGFKFKFRVFPQMPDKLFESLVQASTAWAVEKGQQNAPTYVKSSDPRSGLRIYGVETVAPHENDIKMQFAQLVSNLTAAIDPNNPYFNTHNYVAMNCLLSPGTPVYVPSRISMQETKLQIYHKFMSETMKEVISVVREDISTK
jgi:hypothetical protein